MTKVTIGCQRSTAIQFVAHPDDADCSADLDNAKPSKHKTAREKKKEQEKYLFWAPAHFIHFFF